MYCLDTYALIEITKGNPKFHRFTTNDFAISELTFTEFYYVLLKEHNEKTAEYWHKKLSPYIARASVEITTEAANFRFKHKTQKFSFFDAFGYVFAMDNKMEFVTGDKEFKSLPKVIFVK